MAKAAETGQNNDKRRSGPADLNSNAPAQLLEGKHLALMHESGKGTTAGLAGCTSAALLTARLHVMNQGE